MSFRAWAYIWGVYVTGLVLAGWTLRNGAAPTAGELLMFAALSALATASQLFEVEFGRQSFYPHFVFFMAGALLLPPYLFVLLVIIPHALEWGKEYITRRENRRAWYIQPFNIAGHVISGLAALSTYNAVETHSPALPVSSLLAAVVAALTYVMVNHLLIGAALMLARGISWKDSGILEPENLLPDFILSLLGYTVVVLWNLDFWYMLPALAPLVLMYRALMVPQLKQEAQTDSKTGLWNARHFTTLFQAEMERAKRFDRPLTMLMADLDLLRNINNTYGHLAGDTVLSGIGQIIRQTVREYDIAGRFGGEEFAIVLPETGLLEAKLLAERVRQAVEAHSFIVSTSPIPLRVTMSIGVACFPEDAAEPDALVHSADIAVYQAKLKGRNCVVYSADVPHFIKLESSPIAVEERIGNYRAAFLPKQATQLSNAHIEYSRDTDKLNTDILVNSLVSEQEDKAEERVSSVLEMAADVVESFEALPEADVDDVDATAEAGGQGDAKEAIAAPVVARRDRPGWRASFDRSKLLFGLFVGGVIAAGFATVLARVVLGAEVDYGAVLFITMLSIVAELLQVDLYGPGTVSVSVAVIFASALIAGVPGVASVSAAIALVHYVRRRPEIYKTAFNWATHVLAGLAPAVAYGATQAELRVENLLVLAVPVIASGLIYYIVETGLIAGAISLSTGGRWLATWRERYRWLFSHYMVLSIMGLFLGVAYSTQGPVGLIVFSMPVLMMHYTQRQYVERTEDSVHEMQRMNTELTRANQEVVMANRAMQELNEELFLTLSKIIDARDPYVSGHAAKVSDYATAIAMEMCMPVERMEPLRQAGFLHDIGKIAISEQVLHKPARLTREEYEYIKTHAALGGEFLELSRGLRHLAPFVRHHHEYWDGNGYPDGLRGEDIELEARILAVCDAAEAMASDRPYRKGMSLDEIVAEIKRCAGTQFDPHVAEAFVRVAQRERERLVINSAVEVERKRADNGAILSNGNGNGIGFSGSLERMTGPLSVGQVS